MTPTVVSRRRQRSDVVVSGADVDRSVRIGSVDDANHWIGSTGASSGACLTGLLF